MLNKLPPKRKRVSPNTNLPSPKKRKTVAPSPKKPVKWYDLPYYNKFGPYIPPSERSPPPSPRFPQLPFCPRSERPPPPSPPRYR